MQATVDTRPEDLIVQPVIEGPGQLRYVASPLVTCDAARRRSHSRRRQSHVGKELGQPRPAVGHAPLRGEHRRRHQDQGSPAIPHRRHDERRLPPRSTCPSTSTRASSRRSSSTSPSATRSSPSCARTCPSPTSSILDYVTDFLQHAHAAEERYTVRDGINIGRYAIKLMTSVGAENGESARHRFRHPSRSWARKPCAMSRALIG